MAIAILAATEIANLDYKPMPQLADNLRAILNQGAHRSLQISPRLRLKLRHLHLRKSERDVRATAGSIRPINQSFL